MIIRVRPKTRCIMNLPEIRKKIVSLQEQRLPLELKIINSRSKILPGSLIQVFTSCTKGNCKCTRGEKHGPFLYLNLTVDGKRTQRYAGKKSDKPIVAKVKAYMDYQDTLAHIRKINKEIDSLFNLYRSLLAK